MKEIELKRTGKSKFGSYYLMDNENNFTGTTEQVSKFLENQVPCRIEITGSEGDGKKLIVNRVKVISKSKTDNSKNEFEEPVEVVKPGETRQEFTQASNYKPSVSDGKLSDMEKQESIINQMSVYAAIQIISEHNKISETKIEPTMNNIFTNAKVIKEVLNHLGEDNIDY